MDDVDLLRQALEALKEPALNTRELQSRIAARIAKVYGGDGPANPARAEPQELDAVIPILPTR